MLALVLAAALAPSGPLPDIVRVRMRDYEVSLDLAAYREDPEMKERYRDQFGWKAVLVGQAGEGEGFTISVIAEVDDLHGTSREWRARLFGTPAPGQGVETFEVGEVACQVRTVKTQGLAQVHYNGVPVVGEYSFDIHCSELFPDDGKPVLTREVFTAIVRSFGAASFRCGGGADYPPEALAAFHGATAHEPKEVAWLLAECKARPEDFGPFLVLGERLRSRDVPAAQKAYLRVLEILAKRREPGPKEAFVRMVAEEGAGFCLARTGKAKEGAARIQAAVDAAASSKCPVLPAFTYSLACAWARVPDAAAAARALRAAVDLDPKLREQAAQDPDFDRVRESKAFREVVEKR